MKTLLRTFLLPLLFACAPSDPPVEQADLSIAPADQSAPSDLGAPSDQGGMPDQGAADQGAADQGMPPRTYTWAEVNGWYVLQTGSRVCGPYAVDGGSTPTVESILLQFCVANGFTHYTVGCSAALLQSVTCF